MTISPSGRELPPLSNEEQRFYWIWNGVNNRPLQVFFFVHDWTGFSFQQKYDWLMFAQQNGEILSSSILPMEHDCCEWSVVKTVEPNSDMLVMASKEIRIPGLSELFATVAKKP